MAAPRRNRKAAGQPVAAGTILQAGGVPLQAGDPIPDTYTDMWGVEQHNDLARLEALGLVEGVEPDTGSDDPAESVVETSPTEPEPSGNGVDPAEPVEGAGSDGESA